jgi:hypothetical protein
MELLSSTAEGLSRTNNSVEGCNKGFNTLIGVDHPPIWKFVDKIKEKQSITEMKLNQFVAGTPAQPRRKKYRDLDSRFIRIVEDYENTTVTDYLLGIAQTLKCND